MVIYSFSFCLSLPFKRFLPHEPNIFNSHKKPIFRCAQPNYPHPSNPFTSANKLPKNPYATIPTINSTNIICIYFPNRRRNLKFPFRLLTHPKHVKIHSDIRVQLPPATIPYHLFMKNCATTKKNYDHSIKLSTSIR